MQATEEKKGCAVAPAACWHQLTCIALHCQPRPCPSVVLQKQLAVVWEAAVPCAASKQADVQAASPAAAAQALPELRSRGGGMELAAGGRGRKQVGKVQPREHYVESIWGEREGIPVCCALRLQHGFGAVFGSGVRHASKGTNSACNPPVVRLGAGSRLPTHRSHQAGLPLRALCGRQRTMGGSTTRALFLL